MSYYTYKVRDESGKMIKNYMNASHVNDVALQLRKQNLCIINIYPARIRNFDLLIQKLHIKKIKSKDLGIFCRQLSALLDAGVTIIPAIKTIHENSEHVMFKEALAQIISSIQEGKSFADAVREFPEIFPVIFLSMVETGERSGSMNQVTERLALHFERESEINEKIKSAMAYPITILSISLIAIFVMLTFMFPRIIRIIAANGQELPQITMLMLGISRFLETFWWLAGLIILGGYISAKKALALSSCREFCDKLLLKIPIFGKLRHKIIIARFSRALGSLLIAGIPLIDSLEKAQYTVNNSSIENALEKARCYMVKGEGVIEPLRQAAVFPKLALHILAVGEETGNFEDLLDKIAQFYDREIDHAVSRLTTVLEPLMIILIGFFMGVIIIALMLPVLQIMTGVPGY